MSDVTLLHQAPGPAALLPPALNMDGKNHSPASTPPQQAQATQPLSKGLSDVVLQVSGVHARVCPHLLLLFSSLLALCR
jgi:hypothetical protein